VVPVAEAIRRRAGSGTRVSVAAGCQLPCTSSAGFAAAVRNAAKADVIVAVLGESWDQTGEARSRADLTLPGKQEALFAALKRTGKPVVAVLLSGRPLVFNQLAAQADAILYAWLPGSEGGNAVADVLFGDYNPSGKLPMTFPRSVGQIPITYAAYNTGRPVVAGNSDYRSAYIDLPVTPQYAFGHGLSYTQFAYRNLRLSDKTLRQDGKLTLSFDLANTGKRAGAEVVQLYVRDMVSSIVRPIKELKGFRKLTLQPGEQQTVSFSIDRDMLSFVGADLQRRAEPGEFRLMVGSASDDIRLEAAIELLGDKE
jgi:beta-glucosidase